MVYNFLSFLCFIFFHLGDPAFINSNKTNTICKNNKGHGQLCNDNKPFFSTKKHIMPGHIRIINRINNFRMCEF